MSADASAMRQHALDLGVRGFRVVPLHTPSGETCSCKAGSRCLNAGKHPRIKDWKRRATTDAALITAWWTEWPEANVAVALGRGSGVVALDIDPRNGGDDRLADIEQRPLSVKVT